ncbi:hypothetical protein GPJ56_008145 [Histomonas meleagridis]|uniref:uncharacterized protein n=1 Tax=Histomonas meleagridis TaxID=135588 RepID=UPI00355A93AE|nr:hypothetical protein GPJ56_008145 [Histomonas meleagridis]KAH0803116.1 hypothetical protein GO595_004209 [Histomonas meleagridis]
MSLAHEITSVTDPEQEFKLSQYSNYDLLVFDNQQSGVSVDLEGGTNKVFSVHRLSSIEIKNSCSSALVDINSSTVNFQNAAFDKLYVNECSIQGDFSANYLFSTDPSQLESNENVKNRVYIVKSNSVTVSLGVHSYTVDGHSFDYSVGLMFNPYTYENGVYYSLTINGKAPSEELKIYFDESYQAMLKYKFNNYPQIINKAQNPSIISTMPYISLSGKYTGTLKIRTSISNDIRNLIDESSTISSSLSYESFSLTDESFIPTATNTATQTGGESTATPSPSTSDGVKMGIAKYSISITFLALALGLML